MSCRRLAVLLRWLPADASVWAGEPVSWTMPMELAAIQAELLHASARLLMQLGGARRSQLPKPLRIPRPTVPPPPPARGEGFDVDAFTSYLDRMKV